MTSDERTAEALRRIEECREKRGTDLDLNELGLTRIPSEIGALANLKWLEIAGNKLTSLPAEFRNLDALTHCYASRNLFPDVPAPLLGLKNLEVLSIWSNRIERLPPTIVQLAKLRHLDLDRNALSELPALVGRLTHLEKLQLDSNQLVHLPAELGQLVSLKSLDLRANKLLDLPIELLRLTSLEQLLLHRNPALQIPESVLGNDDYATKLDANQLARPTDILHYYFALHQDRPTDMLRAVGEVKLMLVGRGGAGKTSLRRFFMEEPHNLHEQETPGIALDSFRLPCAQGDVTVRLWDFAGQEITHALHQFFLTEGCVYVLVLDPRSNTEMRDAEYWLGLLKRYGGGAPVLIALNRQDARQGGYDVDRRLLLEHFPFIRGFVPTNCEQREGCETLRQSLREAVESLKDTEPPHLKVPQSWLQVMSDCYGQGPVGSGKRVPPRTGLRGQDDSRGPASPHLHRLTLNEFRTICANRGVTEPARQESLARLLHQLGAVLHFIDEPRLRDTAVLNPHWVTDGVYRLLRFKDRPNSDGTLSVVEALQALPNETESTARFFLRLMERFEMCLPLDEGDNGKAATQWLIPGALGEFQPAAVTQEWQAPGSVRMRYVFDPLPEGVLPRFIVLTHLLSDGQPRWRHGVVLRSGQAAALVRRGEKRHHVEITAFGPAEERLELLEIIQGNLERIGADLPDPKPIAELALEGMPNVFRPVADLQAAEDSHLQVAISTPAGPLAVEPTAQLNLASEAASRSEERVPLRAFLSYSHKDKRAKEVFQLNLTVMAKKRLTTPWHDGLIEPGLLWQAEIERNLQRMDLFVGLLTTAFLASDFIEQVELKAARERLARDDRDFLFVLILVDDVSLDGLDLANYQVLKPGGRAVCHHPSRKAGFDAAQKDLEGIILALQRKLAQRPREGKTMKLPSERARDRVQPPSLALALPAASIADEAPLGPAWLSCQALIALQAPGAMKQCLEAVAVDVGLLVTALSGAHTGIALDALESLSLLVRQATIPAPSVRLFSAARDGLIDACRHEGVERLTAQSPCDGLAAKMLLLDQMVWPAKRP